MQTLTQWKLKEKRSEDKLVKNWCHITSHASNSKKEKVVEFRIDDLICAGFAQWNN